MHLLLFTHQYFLVVFAATTTHYFYTHQYTVHISDANMTNTLSLCHHATTILRTDLMAPNDND
jgi:hypothetical protein